MTTTDTSNGRRPRRSADPAAPTPAQLAARIDEIAAAVAELAQVTQEQQGGSASGSAAETGGGQRPLYDNVEDWVRSYLGQLHPPIRRSRYPTLVLVPPVVATQRSRHRPHRPVVRLGTRPPPTHRHA